jgi:hypothetical protein
MWDQRVNKALNEERGKKKNQEEVVNYFFQSKKFYSVAGKAATLLSNNAVLVTCSTNPYKVKVKKDMTLN